VRRFLPTSPRMPPHRACGCCYLNALVHSGPSTEVCIRIERREDVAIVSVIDVGAGMSAEHAARAFDRFWCLDAGGAGLGSGLGLSIVRGVVEAHAGGVTMISAPGAGITVRVLLPLAGPAGRTTR
jgi:two-component system OmpR family sensor kinase